MEFKFELGEEVKDVITGYVGCVVSQMTHITGCTTYFIQRKYKANEKIDDSQHFDENRLTATGKKVKLNLPVAGEPVKGAIGLHKVPGVK